MPTATEDPPAIATETHQPPDTGGEQMLSIADIRLDGDTQTRVQLNQEAVDAYAEEMDREGIDKFPPVDVFLDDENIYWLGDGFHRVTAAERNGLTEIKAKLRHGSRADALVYNVRANHKNGVARTNADKRRSVMLLLAVKEYYEKSDRVVADLCYVGNQLVGHVRRELDAARKRELCDSHSSPSPAKRVGRDGKARSVVAAKSKPQKDHPQEAAQEPAQETGAACTVASGAADNLSSTGENHLPSLPTGTCVPERTHAEEDVVEQDDIESQAGVSTAEPVGTHDEGVISGHIPPPATVVAAEGATTDGPPNLGAGQHGWDEGFLVRERVEERLARAHEANPSDRYSEVDRELFSRLFTEMTRAINRATAGVSTPPSACQKIAAETAVAVETFIRSGPPFS